MLHNSSIFLKIFIGFWLVTLGSSLCVFLFWLLDKSVQGTRHVEQLAEERRELMGQSLAVYGQTAAEILKSGGVLAVGHYSLTIANSAGIRPYFYFRIGQPIPGGHIPPEVESLSNLVSQSGHVEYTYHGDIFVLAQPVRSENGERFVVVGETKLDENGLIAPSLHRHPAPRLQQEAVLACNDKHKGDLAAFNSPRGEVSGVCLEVPPDNILACIPATHDLDQILRSPGELGQHAPPLTQLKQDGGTARAVSLALGDFANRPGWLVVSFLILLMCSGTVCYMLASHLTAPLSQLSQAVRRMSSGDLSARVGVTLRGRTDEIAGLGRDFDSMAKSIEKLIGLHHRLLRDVAHELRSPLTRLGVALELAKRSKPMALPEAFDRISRESDRLGRLINSLLLLARLDAPDNLKKREVLLSPILEEVVQDVSYEIQGSLRGVELACEARPIVMGDPEMLRQALENVVRNAAKHTADNTRVKVVLSVSGDGQKAMACVRVCDHGPGVPISSLTDIFRPFYRVSESRDQDSGGVGIGLAIADSAIRIHDGTIRAENAPSGGLLVEITIPCLTEFSTAEA